MAAIRHRERMAKIEQGIDPDVVQEPSSCAGRGWKPQGMQTGASPRSARQPPGPCNPGIKMQARVRSPLRGCTDDTPSATIVPCSGIQTQGNVPGGDAGRAGIAGLIWQASPAALPIPVRSLLVFLGSLMAIMAVVTGLFHRGLGKALASAAGVIAGLVAVIFLAAFLLR